MLTGKYENKVRSAESLVQLFFAGIWWNCHWSELNVSLILNCEKIKMFMLQWGKKLCKMDKCFTDYLFCPCKSIGKTGTSFLKCHIVGFFLIFLWIQMLCATYGSEGYIFYATLHRVKSCLSYFVASSYYPLYLLFANTL